MKFRWWSPRVSALFWLALFSAYAVAAVGVVVLDASSDEQAGLSQVSMVTVHASEEMRTLGAAQMAAIYRARSGTPFTSLPPGSTVRVMWPDGSSEYVAIVNPAARDGVRTLPGTQRAPERGVTAGSGAAEREDTGGEEARVVPQVLQREPPAGAR